MKPIEFRNGNLRILGVVVVCVSLAKPVYRYCYYHSYWDERRLRMDREQGLLLDNNDPNNGS